MNIDKRNVKAKQALRNRIYSNTDKEMIEKKNLFIIYIRR